MEELIKWIFSGVLQVVFFKIGNFFIWCISSGRAKFSLRDSSPIAVFLISILGLILFLLVIFVLALISNS